MVSGNVIILSAVGSVTRIDVSNEFAVEPSNNICPDLRVILFVWPSTNTLNSEDVTEFNPWISLAVPPSVTAVLPIVTSSFANWELGIALVPRTPVDEL